MHITSIGIIGYGHFGVFLAELAAQFLPEAKVRIHSSRFMPDSTTFFTLAETCASDIVIPACAISALEKTIMEITPLLSTHTVLVDVCTVKMHPARLFEPLRGKVPFMLTHPMFGPQSFMKLGNTLKGLRIVITDHTLPPEAYGAVRGFFEGLGLAVVEMTAEAHDRALAETLFLTHYLAQVATAAGIVRTSIDTPSFGFFMDAVESVREDTKLFSDVYRFNPFCQRTIARLEQAEQEVAQRFLRA